MFRNGALLLICFSLFFFSLAPIAVQAAEQYTEAHLLVDNSTSSLKQFIADPNMLAFKDLAKRARGIIIIPQMLRGGLVLGGTGESEILLTRDMKSGLRVQSKIISHFPITATVYIESCG